MTVPNPSHTMISNTLDSALLAADTISATYIKPEAADKRERKKENNNRKTIQVFLTVHSIVSTSVFSDKENLLKKPEKNDGKDPKL